MKSLPRSVDVVIAGAGIAGIATAYELAVKHGVTSVALVDPQLPLMLTSDKTGANYRDWWPQCAMVELARRSIAKMQEMHDAGAPFEMNRRGYLYIAKEAESLDAMIASYSGRNIEHIALDRAAIGERFPHLGPDITAAVHVQNAGSVDVVALGRHMLAEAEARGVRVFRAEIVDVMQRGGRVQSAILKTDLGMRHIATRTFVDAAGPFAGRVAKSFGVTLPLVNVLQQKVTIPDPQRVVPCSAPFTIFLPDGIHIKPDGTAENPLVKLGWAFNTEASEPGWEPALSPDFLRIVLEGAARAVPGLEAYIGAGARALPKPVRHDGGYYTKTPDELPLIGPLDVAGAHVVGGLAGYGGMMACAAGEIAAAWITESEQPGWAGAFRPDRFADPAYVATVEKRLVPSGAL